MTTTHIPTARTYTVRGTSVVARTFHDSDIEVFFEVAVLRSHRHTYATFQGIVYNRDGVWHAEAVQPKGPGVVVGTYTDYVDAENALVAAGPGIRSVQGWDGPRPAAPVKKVSHAKATAPKVPLCLICGWELHIDGECTRPDLHWDSLNLTPERAEKAARRQRFLEARNRHAATFYRAELADHQAGLAARAAARKSKHPTTTNA